MMKQLRRLLVILLVSLNLVALRAAEPAPAVQESPTVTKVPVLDEFWIVPLRIHRLKSTDHPQANCNLSDADLQRIVVKVNQVWKYGGVYFGLESIHDTPADDSNWSKVTSPLLSKAQDQLELQADLKPEELKSQLEQVRKSLALDSKHSRHFIPSKTRQFQGFRVYYLHDFNVNGIYYGKQEALVKETAKLRAVKNGIDEPLPRVTAHELGHGLGMPHRQDQINLMASGTTGTSLNEAEVKQARQSFPAVPGSMTYATLQQRQLKPTATDPAPEVLQQWLTELQALTK